ncbi:MAG: cupredoxin domain-containing protein [Bdellovibrionales bacterium]|nr:cupredoxin domain-containing protein [Bdellovibrionales bacterium]
MKSIIMAILFTLNFHPALAQAKDQVVELQVTEKGFEPNSVDVKPGVLVVLKVTRKTDSTCATQIKIKSKNIKKDLPLNKPVTIALGKLDKGELRFGCGMDMITGNIIVR